MLLLNVTFISLNSASVIYVFPEKSNVFVRFHVKVSSRWKTLVKDMGTFSCVLNDINCTLVRV